MLWQLDSRMIWANALLAARRVACGSLRKEWPGSAYPYTGLQHKFTQDCRITKMHWKIYVRQEYIFYKEIHSNTRKAVEKYISTYIYIYITIYITKNGLPPTKNGGKPEKKTPRSIFLTYLPICLGACFLNSTVSSSH